MAVSYLQPEATFFKQASNVVAKTEKHQGTHLEKSENAE